MRCETTSCVKECALRARSGDVHVARVVPLVVDAVVGLTLGLIAHVVGRFVVAILQRIFCIWRYTLYSFGQAFPRLADLHAMADLAMAVVCVPGAGTGCDTASVLGKNVGPFRLVFKATLHTVVSLSMLTIFLIDEALFIPSTQWAPSPPSMLELPACALV